MVEVIATDEFAAWFDTLDDGATEAVVHVVGILEMKGFTLGFPYSSAIAGSRFALRELRVQSGGRPLRIFYAFDPKRQAVLLIGGDKTGDSGFYDRMTAIAERIWEQFLREQEEERKS